MGRNQAEALGAQGRRDAFPFDPDDLTIVTDPKHPLYVDDAAEEPERWMVESVKTHGVIQAITVRKNGETRAGKPIIEVIAGRKRTKAARIANRELRAEGREPIFVYAMVRSGLDGDLAEVVVLENEHRVPDDAITRARKMQRLIDLGRPLERVALSFKCSEKEVKRNVRLLDLDDKVKATVAAGKLSPSVAAELVEFPREVQREKLKEMVASGATRGEAARRTIRGESGGQASNRPRMRGRALVEALSQKVNGETGAALRFVLGDDAALDGHPELKAAAEAAGWKVP